MLEATVLALTAAVLHAGWNLAVKVRADRLAFLGVQFLIGGLIGLVALLVLGDMGEVAWRWAFLSGLIHVPYLVLLALCYRYGDFSLVYPLARGGGALVAALGGAILLADHLPAMAWVAIAIVAGGLASLAAPARGPAVRAALALAAVIGTYTLVDAHGARISHSASYGFATLAATAVTAAVVLTFSRRWVIAAKVARAAPGLCLGAGLAAVAAYALVLAAVRHAPVGYVTALRESSVVIAAFAGWRLLHEPPGRQRVASSCVVLFGLVLLIASG